MKTPFLFFIIAVVLVTSGCVTSSEFSDIIIDADAVPAAEENMKVEADAQILKSLLIKETNYFSDGYIENFKVYDYNPDLTPSKEVLFDSFNEIVEYVVYEKISANEVKRTLFNARNELQTWQITTKNGAGLDEKVKVYSPKDELQTVCDFIYADQGDKLRWIIADSTNTILSDTRYIYENGLKTKTEIYDKNAEPVEYFTYEYAGGNLVLNKHYYGNTFMDAVEYIYKGDNLSEEKYLKSNGSILRTVKYEYDDKGNPVKIEFFNGSGVLKTWMQKEYKYVSVLTKAEIGRSRK